MKVRGSKLVVQALEDQGVPLTLGIPGIHNTKWYDAPVDPLVHSLIEGAKDCKELQ